jgi:hypothetical protein
MTTPFHKHRTRSHTNGLWNMPTEKQAIRAFRMFKAGRLTPAYFKVLCTAWEISEHTLNQILLRKSWKAFPLESFLEASPPADDSPPAHLV